MEWQDDGILISARPHGESAAIIHALTREHGLHAGLVRGGASRKQRPTLQPGNDVQLNWHARLEEHLGNYTVELDHARAALIMESYDALTGLNAATAELKTVLPERQSFPDIYDATRLLFDAFTATDFTGWAPLYIRWELGLLDALGFGLDLSACAATGTTEDLIYVSPRSGRAVSREAGEPYRDRMLTLPQFLLSPDNPVSMADIADGLYLTGHFLEERILLPRERNLPEARLRLEEICRERR